MRSATATARDGTRITVTVLPPPMRVGLTCAAADFASHARTFPLNPFTRIFCEKGDGLLPWSHPKMRTPPGWGRWVSFKDYPEPVALNAWLNGVSEPTWLTWFHERDNSKSAESQSSKARAEFFARWRDLMAVIDAHPRRPLVTAMPIQTLQWTAARSSVKEVKGDGNWRHWFAGVGDGSAWDCYADSWATRYPDPAAFLRIPLEAAEGAGRPLWIPELGSVLLAGDTGAGRAAWIRDVLALLRERGCAGVAWWCALGKAGAKGEVRDFHLADKASADVWRDAMNGGAA